MRKIYTGLLLLLLLGCSDQSGQDHLTMAKEYIENNEVAAAAIELKNALAKQPELAEASYYLGRIHLQSNQIELGSQELSKALEHGFSASEVVRLMYLAFPQKEADLKLVELSHSYKGLTSDQVSEIAYYKIRIYHQLDNKKEAKSLAGTISALNTQSPFKDLSAAYAFLLEADSDAALLQIQNVLFDNPIHQQALKLKGEILLQDDKPFEAASAYRSYYNAYPNDISTAFFLVNLLADLSLTSSAEPIIDNLLNVFPQNIRLNQLKGQARFSDNDYQEAIRFSQKSIDVKPTDSALRVVAASQLALGLNIQANETLSQFEEFARSDALLLSSVGMGLVSEGELNKAKRLQIEAENISQGAEELKRLGMLQLSLNDVSGVDKLKSALDINPDLPFVQKTLASAYYYSGKYKLALESINAWKQESPNDIHAYLLSASIYMKLNQLEKAKQEYLKLETMDDTNLQAKLGLINLEFISGNRVAAERELRQFLVDYPSSIAGLLKLYAIEKQKGNVSSVIESIDTAYQNDSENLALVLLLAKIQSTEGEYAKAASLLGSISNTMNKTEMYWNMLGDVYLRQRDFEKAEKHFALWLKQYPNSPAAIIGNLVLMDGKNQFAKGLEITTAQLNKNSEDSKIRLIHTRFLLMSGDIVAAQASYDKLPEQLKAQPIAKGLLGQLQSINGNHEEAHYNLSSVYEENANARNARLIYMNYIALEKNEKAYRFLNEHVAAHPKDIASLELLAYEQIARDESQAIASYEKILSIQPDNAIALNNVGFLYFEQGNFDKAKNHVQNALKSHPDYVDALDTLAQVLIAQKDYKQALVHLTHATSDKKVKEDIYLNYIEALLLNDEPVLAKEKLKIREFSLKSSMDKIAILKKKYNLS